MSLRKRKRILYRKIRQEYIIIRLMERESFQSFFKGFKEGRIEQGKST